MSLTAHVYCGYPSYGGDWSQSEFDAHKLIHTLKGDAIKGYCTLRRPDGVSTRITTASPGGAFEIWRQWAGAIAAQVEPAGALLVPVPSSTCIAWGGDPKGMKLAEAASRPASGHHACEAIHWAVQYEKASKGGPRDVATLRANARIRNDLQPQRIILIDDVVTLGGHLKACAQALRAMGHTVEHAICAAHTIKSMPAGGLWKIDPWDLEANPFEGLFNL